MAAQYQSFPPALVSPPQGPPPDATFLYLFVVAVAATTTQAPVINPLGVLQTATNNPIPQGYTLMFPAQLGGFVPVTIGSPNFFFQDMQRTFYVTEERQHIIRQFADASYATFPDQPAQIQASEIDFQITAPVFEAKGAVVAKQPVSPSVPANLRPTNSISSTTTTAVFNLSQYLPAEQWQYYFGVTYLPWTLILFANHYHPWIDEFIKLANWQGIPMLLDIRTQQLGLQPDPNDLSNTSSTFDFQSTYGPTGNVINSYPHEIVDTSQAGAYSIYNWELFFHIPFLIGTLLSQNQQFQNAKTWFEYIFNPTNDSPNVPVPNRYWNFLYFNQNTLDGQIGDLLNTLMNPGSPGYQQAYSQVQQWWNNPFDPDSVARLRPVAYEKAVVMAYISNLIAWGDNLFSQNTRESINEATQLYVLADKILGPKPVMVPAQGTVLPVAFKDLQWDALDNALVQLENAFPISITSNPSNSSDSGSSVITSQSRPSTGPVPYFCTPVNSQLLGYWDTVADRLYKIRHCMNIQGQVQQLPLFAPPINPALLVQAAAAGVDLSSVLSDINAAVPYYRFTFMFSKALELCAEVRNLGGQLLSALEKKDAEALSLLRAGQELAVLQAMLQIKQNQINEAQANLQALQDSLAVTQAKQAYYQALVSGGLSTLETAQVNNLTQSQILKQSSQTAGLFGSELSLIPQFDIGASGACSTPVATATFGGQQLSTMASMVAQAFSMQSEFYSFAATMSGLMGGWNRRSAEWQFQLQTAGLEITQINDQINAANIRLQIAQEDLNNQNLQISNAQAVQDFLTNKFTNEDLYSWMVDQVSGVYFQCYQMAYDLAKRAEACFDYELGLSGSNFIQFGYWDSLKQGLLSGEKLYLDLKRMEGAYLDQNKREFEISKSISLVLLDPLALITLKETGQSLVSLPEALFDMDYSGHYMRRIKSLSLTIPCVTGPYTSVNCTLTLLQSKIRSNTQSAAQGNPYLESPIGSDPRFFYNFAATQSIATSTAQNDSGMFEVNFRDERYLPFEGGGVVSQWLISMPTDCNAFDFETITDVIFNLRYTAREGGAPFGAIARSAATLPGPQSQSGISVPTVSFPKKQSNLTRFFSLKHEFPTEWYQFMHPAPMATSETMSIPLTNERFPFQYRGKRITVSQVQMFLQFKAVYPPSVNSSSTPLDDYGSSSLPLTLAPPSVTVTSANGSLATSSGLLGVPFGSIPFSSPAAIYTMAAGQIVPWTLTINSSDIKTVLAGAPNLQLTPAAGGGPFLNPDVIDDLFLVFQYSAQ